jgi:hypothetical protein
MRVMANDMDYVAKFINPTIPNIKIERVRVLQSRHAHLNELKVQAYAQRMAEMFNKSVK